jgi:hypothetical protein
VMYWMLHNIKSHLPGQMAFHWGAIVLQIPG